ncbi:MAG: helix-turn-helix transcriptional regulator [Bacilli bacterium]|nr:helix-turn-helix transcriptional regulator [Bacilli bacterium]
MDLDRIGKFIKELRLKKGLSQNKLSEELHITRQAISNWENGKSLPDSDMLRILSEFFKVSVDDILSGEKIKDKNHIQETALILVDETNKKSSKIKRIIISYITTLLFLLVAFLSYYFITNYNSIKVYMITGESEKLTIRNGIAISTKQKGYFHIGNIINNQKENQTINSVELYFKNEKKKKISLYKSKNTTENYTFKYSFKNRKEQKMILKGIYAEIISSDNEKEIVKLELSEDYNNRFYINTKNSEKIETITNEVETPPPVQEVFEEISEEENNYTPFYDDYIDNSLNEIVEPEPIYNTPTIPVDNTPESVVTEEKEIDYEKVMGLILEHGTDQMGIISYEFMEDNQSIIISTDETCLYIDCMNNNIIESWKIIIETNEVLYQKYENYNEVENTKTSTNKSNKYCEELNNIIHLFLRKIEEGN